MLVALLLSAALHLGLALGLLLRRRAGAPTPPIGVPRVLGAAAAVALVALLELPLLAWLVRLHPFGMLHLAWLDLTAVAPLAGLGLLLARWRGVPVRPGAVALALLALLGIPLALHAQLVAPYDLRVEHVPVPLDPQRTGRDVLVVGVLADLQTPRVGAFEHRAVDALMAGAPDLILVPGDLYQGSPEDFDAALPGFHALLSRLQAPGGVWVVPGNTDYLRALPRLLEGTGARLLRDEEVQLRIGDRQIALLGLDEGNAAGGRLRPIEALAPFEARDAPGEIRILLTHRPDAVMQLSPHSRVDLVVAGHTHGGQVSLPWIGPPLVLTTLPRHIAAGGLHELEGRRLYISRGVGMERIQAPRIRFRVPPEVSLLQLATPDAPDAR